MERLDVKKGFYMNENKENKEEDQERGGKIECEIMQVKGELAVKSVWKGRGIGLHEESYEHPTG